mgnify:CR=1 FL=1
MNLSKLEAVDLRNVWKHEALDFTNWLAKPENLELLSDEVGIDISFIQTEASVGSFNVDILAIEDSTDRKIIIENQLESTDHDHLGKLITYASGVDAEIIIWIVKSVRDEHRQAVEWLNEHTDSKINFFAIQIEVWRIGDSPYAPRFHTIAQPNDWAKAIKSSVSKNELSDTQVSQLAFWTKFKEYAQGKDVKFNLRKPRARSWYNISIGSSNAHVSLMVNSQSGAVACDLYIPNSEQLFSNLHENKEEIESELSATLVWQELSNKKACRIRLVSSDVIYKLSNAGECHE